MSWQPQASARAFLVRGLRRLHARSRRAGRLWELQPLQPMGTRAKVGSKTCPTTSRGAWPCRMAWVGKATWVRMTFQFEWGARKTWTDYLDDVSTVYMNPSRLREAEAKSPCNSPTEALTICCESEPRRPQRGDPGRNDRYGYFLFSLGFRVSKSHNLPGTMTSPSTIPTRPETGHARSGHRLHRVPEHVAVIMDGNGRWAKRRGEERVSDMPTAWNRSGRRWKPPWRVACGI